MEENDDESKEDSTNVQSEKFDPLSALYSKNVVLPFPSAPVLDNVAKANHLLSINENLENKPHPSTKAKKKEQKTKAKEEDVALTTKDVSSIKKKPLKNVFTRMSETEGPLAFLRTCMEKRLRVKVWTRSAKGLRGYCVGFVAAFDKHWNMALVDVQEVWTRPVKRKTYLFGEPKDPPLAWKAMGPMVTPPRVTVTNVQGGKETCKRHVNQMMMRGEHVAFVSVPDV